MNTEETSVDEVDAPVQQRKPRSQCLREQCLLRELCVQDTGLAACGRRSRVAEALGETPDTTGNGDLLRGAGREVAA